MARRGRPPKRDETTPPTPETLARMEQDPLRALIIEGLIDTAGERAADEIREIYTAVCRCVMRRQARYGQEFGMPSGVPVELPDALALAHAKVYLPWVHATKPTVVDATLSLVVDRVAVQCSTAVAMALSNYARRMVRSRKAA